MAHSTSTLVAGADLEFGTKASVTKQNSGDLKLRQSLWLRRFCYSLVALAFLAIVNFTSYEPTSQSKSFAQSIDPIEQLECSRSRYDVYWNFESLPWIVQMGD